jgi:hypothetical protein
MLSGDIPFETDEEIMRGSLVWFDQLDLSETVKSLVESCLHTDQRERMSLQQLREHHWLAGDIRPSSSLRRNKRSFNLASLSSAVESSS